MITRCNRIHFAKQRARRRSCPTLCSMVGVLAAVPFISQQTTGDFTNRIFANAAVGVPWLGQIWRTGQLHTQISNPITPKGNGSWEFPDKQEQIPSTHLAPNPIRCRQCRLNLQESYWKKAPANWDYMHTPHHSRFCQSPIKTGPPVRTAAIALFSDVSGVRSRVLSQPFSASQKKRDGAKSGPTHTCEKSPWAPAGEWTESSTSTSKGGSIFKGPEQWWCARMAQKRRGFFLCPSPVYSHKDLPIQAGWWASSLWSTSAALPSARLSTL